MRRPRPPHEVVAAWLATGPIGHLVAAVADWAVLLARLAGGRVTRRWRRPPAPTQR